MRKTKTGYTIRAIRHRLTLVGVATGLLAVTSCATAQPVKAPVSSLPQVAWMQGYWTGTTGGVEIEELWFPPRGNVMVGLHVDAFPSGRSFFEYLRIEAAGDTLVFIASPMGRAPTRFPATLVEDGRVVFENPDHDFPKRIEYRIDETGRLHAAASGREGDSDRTLQWTWEKKRFPGD